MFMIVTFFCLSFLKLSCMDFNVQSTAAAFSPGYRVCFAADLGDLYQIGCMKSQIIDTELYAGRKTAECTKLFLAGTRLVSGTRLGTILVWDVNSTVRLGKYRKFAASISHLKQTLSSNQIITASHKAKSSIKMLDIETGKTVSKNNTFKDVIIGLDSLNNSSAVILADVYSTFLWDYRTNKIEWLNYNTFLPIQIAGNQSGTIIALGAEIPQETDKAQIKLMDLRNTKKEINDAINLECPNKGIEALQFDDSGEQLAYVANNKLSIAHLPSGTFTHGHIIFTAPLLALSYLDKAFYTADATGKIDCFFK